MEKHWKCVQTKKSFKPTYEQRSKEDMPLRIYKGNSAKWMLVT